MDECDWKHLNRQITETAPKYDCSILNNQSNKPTNPKTNGLTDPELPQTTIASVWTGITFRTSTDITPGQENRYDGTPTSPQTQNKIPKSSILESM